MSRHREAENAENVIALERVLREARAEEEAVEAAVAGMNGAGSGWDEDPDWHLRYEPGAATVRPDIDPEADPGFPWLIDAADLLAEPDPGPTPWLVRDLIVDRALVAAVGRWKTTKTYGFLDVAISVVAGRPAFRALEVERPGPVVYVIEESGRAALWRRLDALRRGRGIDVGCAALGHPADDLFCRRVVDLDRAAGRHRVDPLTTDVELRVLTHGGPLGALDCGCERIVRSPS